MLASLAHVQHLQTPAIQMRHIVKVVHVVRERVNVGTSVHREHVLEEETLAGEREGRVASFEVH